MSPWERIIRVQSKITSQGDICLEGYYDEVGNLVETTVYITYKGDDGTNYRTSVVIENQ